MMPEAAASPRIDPAGLASATLCCFLWGANAVAAKYAIAPEGLPPVGGAALRFVLGVPVVWWVCGRASEPRTVDRRLWWLVAVHGLLAALQIGSFNWGTGLSQAGRSSVFINIHPLVVAPLAWLLLGERMGWRGVTGLLSAALGVGIMLARRPEVAATAADPASLVGDWIVLGSGVCFGVQAIAQKLTFRLIPPTTLLLTQSAVAIPLCLAYSVAFEGIDRYHFTAPALLGVTFQGMAVSGLCFAVWMMLLRRYPAGRLAAVAFLTPLFGIMLGTLLRREALTWPLAAGSGLVGLGIYLAAAER